jgi:hypothetical protein
MASETVIFDKKIIIKNNSLTIKSLPTSDAYDYNLIFLAKLLSDFGHPALPSVLT